MQNVVNHEHFLTYNQLNLCTLINDCVLKKIT